VALAVAGNVPDWQGRLADVQTIETELDTILANFAAAAAANRPATDGGPAYSGMEVMKGIISDGKIVKELADDHQEVELVLNTVADTTVDQEFVRSASQAGPELPARAQVFAVDEWRLRQLAEAVADDETDQRRAYLSMLVYTVATSTVLTKGDQRVRMTQASETMVPVAV